MSSLAYADTERHAERLDLAGQVRALYEEGYSSLRPVGKNVYDRAMTLPMDSGIQGKLDKLLFEAQLEGQTDVQRKIDLTILQIYNEKVEEGINSVGVFDTVSKRVAESFGISQTYLDGVLQRARDYSKADRDVTNMFVDLKRDLGENYSGIANFAAAHNRTTNQVLRELSDKEYDDNAFVTGLRENVYQETGFRAGYPTDGDLSWLDAPERMVVKKGKPRPVGKGLVKDLKRWWYDTKKLLGRAIYRRIYE